MKCRHCRADATQPFLDLGTAPPSNAYLEPAQLDGPEQWYPLRILVCTKCWLVQTEDFANREALFTAEYAYFSSMSKSWLKHAEKYVDDMVARFGLTGKHMVTELAANDGYLLQYVRQRGIPCYGVEPTKSTAAAAKAKGIEIVEEFFGVDLAKRLVAKGKSADLLAANNVLAHVPDINDFVAGVAQVLTPSGVATFEFPHLMRMVQEAQFDTAYHEHFSYLSLRAVKRIFEANGLEVFDVTEHPTHGGSLRVFAQRRGGPHQTAPGVDTVLAAENAAGMGDTAFYTGFQAIAERVKNDLLAFLIEARKEGKRVAAYGAAAKGNTLLNFAGVKSDLLPFAVDAAPSKQGRYLPGSRIPVRAPAALREQPLDYVLILPWNIAPEIEEQLSDLRTKGTRLVVAVPKLTVW